MSDAPDTTPAPKGRGGFLGKKFGALPLWAYALILAGMLALGFWWKSNSKKTSSAASPTDLSYTGDNLGAENAAGGVSNGGTSSYSGGGGGVGTGTASTSNAQWAQNAADALMASGQYTQTDVQTALAAYLSGQALTGAQSTIVNQALSSSGTPPQGVIPTATSNASVNYKVVRGDSLTSIAKMFYGDASRWKDIYQANLSVIGKDPQNLGVGGQTLILPGNGLLATPQGLESEPIPVNHKYTVQYGESMRQLAQRFYGDVNAYQQIYDANKGIIKPGTPVPAGTVINIP